MGVRKCSLSVQWEESHCLWGWGGDIRTTIPREICFILMDLDATVSGYLGNPIPAF
jgi:hypothetical protein